MVRLFSTSAALSSSFFFLLALLCISLLSSPRLTTMAVSIADDQIRMDEEGPPMDKSSQKHKRKFVFDVDTASKETCDEAKRLNGDTDEDFRLYCINTDDAFENCALSCSKALQFEKTVGVTSSSNSGNEEDVSFHDLKFALGPKGDDVYTAQHGIPTVLAVIPLWNSQAQYMYELLEKLYTKFSEDDDNNVQVIGLPLFIEEAMTIEKDKVTGKLTFSGVEFEPFAGGSKVKLLQMTTPQQLGYHPLLTFLQTLHYVSGYPGFDVYTDRPVVFVIDGQGKYVERLVTPALAELQDTVTKYLPYTRSTSKSKSKLSKSNTKEF